MILRVKICGITRRIDAEAAAAAGADAVGFVFWGGSPRCVAATAALKIAEGLPDTITKVGVFVDAPIPVLLETMRSARLSTAQLHGSEGPGYLHGLDVDCYRVFRVAPGAGALSLADEIARFGGGLFMLDSGAGSLPGGGGVRFDWEIAREIGSLVCGAGRARFVLAGGLTPGNVADAIRMLRPFGLAGVDVSSGVETAPGVKDPARIRAFVDAVRSAT